MLVAVIVGCEVGFWVFLLGGLAVRYLLHRRRASVVLLVLALLVDVVLLVVSIVDIQRGATATFAHGLAAVYIGFSVAFGHRMVRWADQRFAHRFACGPPPWRPPTRGWARASYEWREFGRALLAAGVAAGLLGAGIGLVADPSRTAALVSWLPRLGLILAFWFLLGPLWATLLPGKDPDVSRTRDADRSGPP